MDSDLGAMNNPLLLCVGSPVVPSRWLMSSAWWKVLPFDGPWRGKQRLCQVLLGRRSAAEEWYWLRAPGVARKLGAASKIRGRFWRYPRLGV